METIAKSDVRVNLRWVPKDSRLIEHALGVCYVQDTTNGPSQTPAFTVCAYRGTAGKSSFYERYRTAEARDKRVAQFFADLEAHEQMLNERKAERSKPHTLQVGDVITNSWGYDQTNVDMYQVVKATANFVWLQPIAGEMVPDEGCGPMSGRVRPETPIRQILTREVRDYGEYDQVSGLRPVTLKTVAVEPKKRKAEGNNVRFDHGSGCKWDGPIHVLLLVRLTDSADCLRGSRGCLNQMSPAFGKKGEK